MDKDKIARILALYNRWGSSDYIGESITQIEHALQCAKLAANDARLDCYDGFVRNCVIVAALLHDIGHLVGLEDGEMEMRLEEGAASLGIVGHEGVGAAFLRNLGMPGLVCDLVAGHVAAKRYLCTTREGYYGGLSHASKQTMELQGGLMTKEGIREFESGVMPELKVYLREYDDGGKKKEINLSSSSGGMLDYKPHLETALLHGRLFV